MTSPSVNPWEPTAWVRKSNQTDHQEDHTIDQKFWLRILSNGVRWPLHICSRPNRWHIGVPVMCQNYAPSFERHDCALCNFLEPCMAPGRPYKLFDSWFEFVRLLKRTTIHPSDPKMEPFNGWWDGPLHDHSLWPKNWTLLTSFKVLKSKPWESPRQGVPWIKPASNISFPLTKELEIITIFIILKCWSIWVYMSGGFPS